MKLWACLGGPSHDCAFTHGTPCTLIGAFNALEQGDLESGRAGPKQTRSEGGSVLASPRGRCFFSLEDLLAGCCICGHGRLITSFPSARKKENRKGWKVHSESLI